MAGKTSIDVAEKKLIRKIKDAEPKWVDGVKDPSALEGYITGIASFSGIPEDTVRRSNPVKHWEDFQKNASDYASIWSSETTRAVESGEWRKKYIRAFGGTA